jgi:uncharacterized protein (UPF0332 family)
MKGSDFLLVAKNLSENNDSCFQKSSVSRAYYAAFHDIKALAEKLGFKDNGNGSIHWQLSEFLITESDELKEIGAHLRNLHKKRADCDYKLGKKIGKNDAKFAILQSETLVENLKVIYKSVR